VNDELEKIFVFFDQAFLKQFQDRYQFEMNAFTPADTLIRVKNNVLLPGYMQSLLPHYSHLKIAATFMDVKREELLLILLQSQPELAGLFFDYDVPAKINLEEFMSHNFRFNVSVERFAYLTGRSLSAFKRDFRACFGDTPNRWLMHKRLQEAYFLIEQKQLKPSEVYLDLGFETLQHFSFAFKKTIWSSTYSNY
jgi:AraC-like DNA-binding protein